MLLLMLMATMMMIKMFKMVILTTVMLMMVKMMTAWCQSDSLYRIHPTLLPGGWSVVSKSWPEYRPQS